MEMYDIAATICLLIAIQCIGRSHLFPPTITAARCEPCRDTCAGLQNLHEER